MTDAYEDHDLVQRYAVVAYTFKQDPVALLRDTRSIHDVAIRMAAHNFIEYLKEEAERKNKK